MTVIVLIFLRGKVSGKPGKVSGKPERVSRKTEKCRERQERMCNARKTFW